MYNLVQLARSTLPYTIYTLLDGSVVLISNWISFLSPIPSFQAQVLISLASSLPKNYSHFYAYEYKTRDLLVILLGK